MKKKVPVVNVAEVETAYLAGLSLEATVALADLAGAVKEGLLGMCADVGLMVMAQMFDAEMIARVGPKHAKIPGRQANWHGTTKGAVVLGGREVTVTRPRGRTVDETEVELETWAAFSSKDLLDRLTTERMLAGVATRRHVDVAEPLSGQVEAAAKATGRSSVSRRFKRATEAALAELMARDLSGLDVAVIMIDGLEIAGQCVVVALIITTDGTKVPVGLWLGDTENKTVVTALLADLQARGLSVDGGLLAVLDGAKHWRRGSRRCSATAPRSKGAPCTNAAMSRDICPKSSARRSTGASPGPSPTPIPRRVSTPPGASPASSRPIIPTRPPACSKDSRRCSPSAASASPAASPPP